MLVILCSLMLIFLQANIPLEHIETLVVSIICVRIFEMNIINYIKI
jgi:hypothetical protein